MAEEFLIVLNGTDSENTGTIDIYDPESNTWSELVKLEINRVRSCSIIFEEKLFIIGGAIDGHYISDVDTYDFKTGEYGKIKPLPDPIYNCGVTEMYGYLYLVGGASTGEFPYDSGVIRYNSYDDEWEVMAYSRFVPRNSTVVGFYSEIFVISGSTDFGVLKDVSAFDPNTSTWKDCAPLNEVRFGAPAVALNNFIYIFGGQNENSEYSRTAERYDPNSDTWTYIENGSWIRSFSEACVINNSIVIAGGMCLEGESIGFVGYIEEYVPTENKYNTIAPMKQTRSFFDLINVPSDMINKSAAMKKKRQLESTKSDN